MTKQSKYAKSLSELEREVHVDPEDMIEERPTEVPPVYVDPVTADRNRLLGPTGDGRLNPGS